MGDDLVHQYQEMAMGIEGLQPHSHQRDIQFNWVPRLGGWAQSNIQK